MSPTVLRVSGTPIDRNGIMVTPRAAIHSCETCGIEGARHGFTDPDGKRRYYCNEHLPKGKGPE